MPILPGAARGGSHFNPSGRLVGGGRKALLLDTSSRHTREALQRQARERREEIKQLARSAQSDLIEVSTDGAHLDDLVRFFDMRERKLGIKK